VRDAEIGDARDPVLADEHVLRRDVAVDEMERAAGVVHQLVGCMQPFERVDHDAQRNLGRKWTSLPGQASDQGVQREPVHELHDEKQPLRTALDRERGDDVRVTNARGEPRLVEEHRDEVLLARDVRVHELQGDEPLEAALADDAREVHGGHPALRDGRRSS